MISLAVVPTLVKRIMTSVSYSLMWWCLVIWLLHYIPIKEGKESTLQWTWLKYHFEVAICPLSSYENWVPQTWQAKNSDKALDSICISEVNKSWQLQRSSIHSRTSTSKNFGNLCMSFVCLQLASSLKILMPVKAWKCFVIFEKITYKGEENRLHCFNPSIVILDAGSVNICVLSGGGTKYLVWFKIWCST